MATEVNIPEPVCDTIMEVSVHTEDQAQSPLDKFAIEEKVLVPAEDTKLHLTKGETFLETRLTGEDHCEASIISQGEKRLERNASEETSEEITRQNEVENKEFNLQLFSGDENQVKEKQGDVSNEQTETIASKEGPDELRHSAEEEIQEDRTSRETITGATFDSVEHLSKNLLNNSKSENKESEKGDEAVTTQVDSELLLENPIDSSEMTEIVTAQSNSVVEDKIDEPLAEASGSQFLQDELSEKESRHTEVSAKDTSDGQLTFVQEAINEVGELKKPEFYKTEDGEIYSGKIEPEVEKKVESLNVAPEDTEASGPGQEFDTSQSNDQSQTADPEVILDNNADDTTVVGAEQKVKTIEVQAIIDSDEKTEEELSKVECLPVTGDRNIDTSASDLVQNPNATPSDETKARPVDLVNVKEELLERENVATTEVNSLTLEDDSQIKHEEHIEKEIGKQSETESLTEKANDVEALIIQDDAQLGDENLRVSEHFNTEDNGEGTLLEKEMAHPIKETPTKPEDNNAYGSSEASEQTCSSEKLIFTAEDQATTTRQPDNAPEKELTPEVDGQIKHEKHLEEEAEISWNEASTTGIIDAGSLVMHEGQTEDGSVNEVENSEGEKGSGSVLSDKEQELTSVGTIIDADSTNEEFPRKSEQSSSTTEKTETEKGDEAATTPGHSELLSDLVPESTIEATENKVNEKGDEAETIPGHSELLSDPVHESIIEATENKINEKGDEAATTPGHSELLSDPVHESTIEATENKVNEKRDEAATTPGHSEFLSDPVHESTIEATEKKVNEKRDEAATTPGHSEFLSDPVRESTIEATEIKVNEEGDEAATTLGYSEMLSGIVHESAIEATENKENEKEDEAATAEDSELLLDLAHESVTEATENKENEQRDEAETTPGHRELQLDLLHESAREVEEFKKPELSESENREINVGNVKLEVEKAVEESLKIGSGKNEESGSGKETERCSANDQHPTPDTQEVLNDKALNEAEQIVETLELKGKIDLDEKTEEKSDEIDDSQMEEEDLRKNGNSSNLINNSVGTTNDNELTLPCVTKMEDQNLESSESSEYDINKEVALLKEVHSKEPVAFSNVELGDIKITVENQNTESSNRDVSENPKGLPSEHTNTESIYLADSEETLEEVVTNDANSLTEGNGSHMKHDGNVKKYIEKKSLTEALIEKANDEEASTMNEFQNGEEYLRECENLKESASTEGTKQTEDVCSREPEYVNNEKDVECNPVPEINKVPALSEGTEQTGDEYLGESENLNNEKNVEINPEQEDDKALASSEGREQIGDEYLKESENLNNKKNAEIDPEPADNRLLASNEGTEEIGEEFLRESGNLDNEKNVDSNLEQEVNQVPASSESTELLGDEYGDFENLNNEKNIENNPEPEVDKVSTSKEGKEQFFSAEEQTLKEDAQVITIKKTNEVACKELNAKVYVSPMTPENELTNETETTSPGEALAKESNDVQALVINEGQPWENLREAESSNRVKEVQSVELSEEMEDSTQKLPLEEKKSDTSHVFPAEEQNPTVDPQGIIDNEATDASDAEEVTVEKVGETNPHAFSEDSIKITESSGETCIKDEDIIETAWPESEKVTESELMYKADVEEKPIDSKQVPSDDVVTSIVGHQSQSETCSMKEQIHTEMSQENTSDVAEKETFDKSETKEESLKDDATDILDRDGEYSPENQVDFTQMKNEEHLVKDVESSNIHEDEPTIADDVEDANSTKAKSFTNETSTGNILAMEAHVRSSPEETDVIDKSAGHQDSEKQSPTESPEEIIEYQGQSNQYVVDSTQVKNEEYLKKEVESSNNDDNEPTTIKEEVEDANPTNVKSFTNETRTENILAIEENVRSSPEITDAINKSASHQDRETEKSKPYEIEMKEETTDGKMRKNLNVLTGVEGIQENSMTTVDGSYEALDRNIESVSETSHLQETSKENVDESSSTEEVSYIKDREICDDEGKDNGDIKDIIATSIRETEDQSNETIGDPEDNIVQENKESETTSTELKIQKIEEQQNLDSFSEVTINETADIIGQEEKNFQGLDGNADSTTETPNKVLLGYEKYQDVENLSKEIQNSGTDAEESESNANIGDETGNEAELQSIEKFTESNITSIEAKEQLPSASPSHDLFSEASSETVKFTNANEKGEPCAEYDNRTLLGEEKAPEDTENVLGIKNGTNEVIDNSTDTKTEVESQTPDEYHEPMLKCQSANIIPELQQTAEEESLKEIASEIKPNDFVPEENFESKENKDEANDTAEVELEVKKIVEEDMENQHSSSYREEVTIQSQQKDEITNAEIKEIIEQEELERAPESANQAHIKLTEEQAKTNDKELEETPMRNNSESTEPKETMLESSEKMEIGTSSRKDEESEIKTGECYLNNSKEELVMKIQSTNQSQHEGKENTEAAFAVIQNTNEDEKVFKISEEADTKVADEEDKAMEANELTNIVPNPVEQENRDIVEAEELGKDFKSINLVQISDEISIAEEDKIKNEKPDHEAMELKSETEDTFGPKQAHPEAKEIAQIIPSSIDHEAIAESELPKKFLESTAQEPDESIKAEVLETLEEETAEPGFEDISSKIKGSKEDDLHYRETRKEEISTNLKQKEKVFNICEQTEDKTSQGIVKNLETKEESDGQVRPKESVVQENISTLDTPEKASPSDQEYMKDEGDGPISSNIEIKEILEPKDKDIYIETISKVQSCEIISETKDAITEKGLEAVAVETTPDKNPAEDRFDATNTTDEAENTEEQISSEKIDEDGVDMGGHLPDSCKNELITESKLEDLEEANANKKLSQVYEEPDNSVAKLAQSSAKNASTSLQLSEQIKDKDVETSADTTREPQDSDQDQQQANNKVSFENESISVIQHEASSEYSQGQCEAAQPSENKDQTAHSKYPHEQGQNKAEHEDANTDEEKGDKAESGEQIKYSGPETLVVVDAEDLEVKTSHKKTHNLLSGVGSKVKHSIAKVKKVITGKSSHHKPPSPPKH